MPLAGPPFRRYRRSGQADRAALGKPAGRGGAPFGGDPMDLARARAGFRPPGTPLRRHGPQARRPGCLADAQPQRAAGALSRLPQGAARDHAAQLPLHGAGDRPRARHDRSRGPAGPRRAGPGSGRQPRWPTRCRSAASPMARTTAADRAWKACWPKRLPMSTLSDARAGRSLHHLLHLGQHRQAEGRDPHPARPSAPFWRATWSGPRNHRGTTSSCPAPRSPTRAACSIPSWPWRSARASSCRAPTTATRFCPCCTINGRPCCGCCPRR